MPAAIPILVAVTAASAIYGGVEANQERQHAKGAAQAQEVKNNAAIEAQKKSDLAAQNQKSNQASSTQQAALAALRANMGTQGALGGTILTGPGGAAPAPAAAKTLLGV